MRRSSTLPLFALALPLVACGGGDARRGAEVVADRKAVLEAEGEVNEAEGRARSALVAQERQEAAKLAFESIALSPEQARANTEEFTARTTLQPGASAFTEVAFRWWVADREIPAYSRPKLARREGHWKTGDTIRVQATATDEKGRSAVSEYAAVVVDNTTPQIVTDLKNVRNLDGITLEAVDADGDAVTWSVEGDPPGVTINAAGQIRVRVGQRTEDWSGEAVFVATDPWGARAEIHIPLGVNAAKAARTEQTGTRTTHTDSRTMTDDEMIKAAESDADKFEGMSETEINAELDRRRKAEGGDR